MNHDCPYIKCQRYCTNNKGVRESMKKHPCIYQNKQDCPLFIEYLKKIFSRASSDEIKGIGEKR